MFFFLAMFFGVMGLVLAANGVSLVLALPVWGLGAICLGIDTAIH